MVRTRRVFAETVTYYVLCLSMFFIVDMKDFCVLCGQREGSDDEHGYHWVGINHNYYVKKFM